MAAQKAAPGSGGVDRHLAVMAVYDDFIPRAFQHHHSSKLGPVWTIRRGKAGREQIWMDQGLLPGTNYIAGIDTPIAEAAAAKLAATSAGEASTSRSMRD